MRKFIDISNWQGHINWNKINANPDIWWVYCNIGDGRLWDTNPAGAPLSIRDSYMECAKFCRKPFGPYYFARHNVEPFTAIDLIENRLTGKETLPLALDLEDDGMPDREFAIEYSSVFLSLVSHAFGIPLLYTGAFYKADHWFPGGNGRPAIANDPRLAKYLWWLPQYGVTSPDCNGPRRWDMWQFGGSLIDGINGDVDTNYISDSFIANASEFVDRYKMKRIGLPTTDTQWFLAVDGNGVIRRVPIHSLEEIVVLQRAGIIDTGDTEVLTNPVHIAIFEGYRESNERGSDEGALVLAMNTIAEIRKLGTAMGDGLPESIDVDELATAMLRQLGIAKVG